MLAGRLDATRRRALALFVASALAAAACSARRTMDTAVAATPAPRGAESLAGVTWVQVPVPAQGSLPAAVARSIERGPHPVLILLHGTHGFAREYVDLARDLAREAGVVVVVPCWFAGRRGASIAVVTPIECPDAPRMPDSANTPAALAVVNAIVDAARSLPDVRADRVSLFGHSRGAVAALFFALERGGLQPGTAGTNVSAPWSIVLNDGAYPPSLTARAAALRVPTLLLHGTADAIPGGQPDGGSEMTRVERARAFEAAVRAAGTTSVSAEYFDGANHVGLFTIPEQRSRTLRLIAVFLRDRGVR